MSDAQIPKQVCNHLEKLQDSAEQVNGAGVEQPMTRDVAGLLYEAAKSADNAYQKVLEAEFGKQAGDARYDKRGESTLLLKNLKQAKQAADLAWHNAMRNNAFLGKR